MVNTDMIVLVAVAAGAYFWLSSFSLADTVKGVGTAVAEGAVEVAKTLVAEGEEFVASNLEDIAYAVEDQFEALECAVVDCTTEADWGQEAEGGFDFPAETSFPAVQFDPDLQQDVDVVNIPAEKPPRPGLFSYGSPDLPCVPWYDVADVAAGIGQYC